MIGTKIGQLAIQRKLGEGGMGAVYYAEHELLHTQRAVKVLLPQWTQAELVVQRFVNEARAAALIQHRNIIKVHDCGQLPDGAWYIVMDYLEGATLARFGASQGGPLSPHLALQLLAPTANGLEAAHRAGIVHRDLKPDNIFLTRHEHGQNPHHPVILDFGIAKLGEHEGGAITKTGMTAGTPAYMAPEQIQNSKLVDARSDVYALGVIAYQMITGGYLPYQTEPTLEEYNQLSAAEIYYRQKSSAPIDPRERRSGIPDRWATAIRAALEADPARRLPSPRALVLKLLEGTAGDELTAGGADIVRAYAHELLEVGNLLETVRGMKPAARPAVPAAAAARYQLGERIGTGGMAEVFRGTMVGAEGIARPVAVKRVLAAIATPELASLFVREAQLASLLSHPNVVPVLDFDRDAEGRSFLVMEYVEGPDLARLARTGPLPYSAVSFLASEILCGLGYAHDLPTGGPVRGLVHRDVSPQNVLLSWEGAVKVSDFGIAKAREASAVAASFLIKGKVAYMSPEQANGESLDGRSDLFAVGVMLWELLAGRALFEGSHQEILAQLLLGPIPRPSTVRADVPADLEAVAMRLLERDRSQRFERAALAVDALAACADTPRNGRLELVRLLAARFPEAAAARGTSTQPGAEAQPAAGIWAASGTTMRSAASEAAAPPPRRLPRWPWLAASVLGAAGGALALLLTARGAERAPASMSSPPPPPAAADEAAPPAPAPQPAPSTLTIATEPPGAAIRIDGAPRGNAPITLRPERGQALSIEARHAGFEPLQRAIVAERDPQTITLKLIARPPAASPPARPALTPPAAKPPAAKPPPPRGSFDREAVSGD